MRLRCLTRKRIFQIYTITVVIVLINLWIYSSSVTFNSALISNYHSSIFGGDKLFPCDDHTTGSFYAQRGRYWVLYNYFKGTRFFRCDQSITYTTHSDWTFLDNLVPLLERWQGPVSITLYTPGTDFDETIKRVLYLRECGSSNIVKELVSFHLFFDRGRIPRTKIESSSDQYFANCSDLEKSITFGESLKTFRQKRKLVYPVNVARNVAREMATTHYVFPSDIELYPSPNLIPRFLDMIRRISDVPQQPIPKVFVLSVFEVEADVPALPQDKREMVYMVRNRTAVPFHKYMFYACHRVPNLSNWINATVQDDLNVFYVAKRYEPFHHWEPFYIGTKFEPMYEERLSWEGGKDKMVQGYVLCLLDYEFHILDNAFLVHKPGIKRKKHNQARKNAMKKQDNVIEKFVLPEIHRIYGKREGCYV